MTSLIMSHDYCKTPGRKQHEEKATDFEVQRIMRHDTYTILNSFELNGVKTKRSGIFQLSWVHFNLNQPTSYFIYTTTNHKVGHNCRL